MESKETTFLSPLYLIDSAVRQVVFFVEKKNRFIFSEIKKSVKNPVFSSEITLFR